MPNLLSSNKLGYGITGYTMGGPIGALFGYGLGGSLDQINNNYGGDVGAYLGDVFKNLFDFRKKNIGQIITGALDPGGVFTDMVGGKKRKKKKEPVKIAGKTQEEWVEELGMDEKEYSGLLNSIVRTLATGAAESRNRISELTAMNRAPFTTQLAAERGVNIKANEAALEGEMKLQQLRENINRQAQLTALQLFAQKESQDEEYLRQQELQAQQSMNNLLGMLGYYLTEKYLNKGDKTTTPTQTNTTQTNTTQYYSQSTWPPNNLWQWNNFLNLPQFTGR